MKNSTLITTVIILILCAVTAPGAMAQDSTFVKSGNELLLTEQSDLQQYQSDVLVLPDSAFVILYYDYSGNTYGKIFNNDNSLRKDIFNLSTQSSYYKRYAAAALNTDTTFIAVWRSDDRDGNSSGIFGQVFDLNGNKIGNDFQINTYTASNQDIPDICALDSG